MTAVIKEQRSGYYRLDPVPSDKELTTFYESRYYDLIRKGGRAPELRRLSEGGSVAQRELEWLREGMYRDIAETLKEIAPTKSRVLDVGAGMGDFVRFMREAGYDAAGIEPAKEPSEAARNQGLPIHTATLSSWASDPRNTGTADVVVMLNVLEHVPDPELMLAQTRALLSPGGLVVIRVPNDFSDIQDAARRKLNKEPWWICAPDHINYFGVHSLGKFLTNCGMETVFVMTDFPMEFFLLMGDDYTSDPAVGSTLHQKRVQFELALPSPLRRKLYTALASAGIGRNVMAFAKKTD
jgi:2-polyprenyl-3-methyl-5-hydroxy-6-metoxy-1,4-benzoquinol methylase